MIAGQFAADLPRQLSEKTLHPITPDRNAEPFPDHNANPADRQAGSLANQQVEAGSGQPPAMLLDVFDIAAGSKKKGPVSCTLRHRPAH
jgi:hypothetical protein